MLPSMFLLKQCTAKVFAFRGVQSCLCSGLILSPC